MKPPKMQMGFKKFLNFRQHIDIIENPHIPTPNKFIL